MHHIPGDYYSVKPVAVTSPIDVYDCNKRSILELDTPHFGRVLYIMVAAVQVGSIKLTVGSGDSVKKVCRCTRAWSSCALLTPSRAAEQPMVWQDQQWSCSYTRCANEWLWGLGLVSSGARDAALVLEVPSRADPDSIAAYLTALRTDYALPACKGQQFCCKGNQSQIPSRQAGIRAGVWSCGIATC